MLFHDEVTNILVSSHEAVQSGDWSVTLEGLYRIRVGKASVSFPREFWLAAVTAVSDGPEASTKCAATSESTAATPAACLLMKMPFQDLNGMRDRMHCHHLRKICLCMIECP